VRSNPKSESLELPPTELRSNRRFSLASLPFAMVIFASGFLVFSAQPMVGKHILPWFGGAAGVWALCLAVYQITLFLGYAYAHLLVRFLSPRSQLALHAALFCAVFWTIPLLPDDHWKPDSGGDPSGAILAMLIAHVALPLLVLSSTVPLAQVWLARRLPDRSPYPLFALSNVGALLALLAYPFVVEPSVGVAEKSAAWTWGFAVTAVGVLGCAWLSNRPASPTAPTGEGPVPSRPTGGAGVMTTLRWMGFAGCAVMLLMSITNELCLSVASVPLLWIVPLAIYLLTLVLCFSSDRFHRRWLFATIALISLAVLFGASGLGAVSGIEPIRHLPFEAAAGAYLLLLFSGCMLMHGELYRLRPGAQSLTRFYLSISTGGALAGLFVGLAAPRLFDAYHELPIALALCWLLVLGAARKERPAGMASVWSQARWRATELITVVGLVALVVQAFWVAEGVLSQQRNFFGIMRVFEAQKNAPRRHKTTLMRGTTVRGGQYRSPAREAWATGHYGRNTGIGFVMQNRNSGVPLRVGVVGLGIGSLATYGLPGDEFTFYEVDPEVVRIARDVRYFTYLEKSRAAVEIVEGDPRLALESDLRDEDARKFHVLVIDAFNEGSVPVHLLTHEAFETFAQHLQPGGVLALHVSNRHLVLTPLVFRLANSVGLHGIEIVNENMPVRASAPSKWILLSADARYLATYQAFVQQRLQQMKLAPTTVRVNPITPGVVATAPLWTDDYSDLLSVLK